MWIRGSEGFEAGVTHWLHSMAEVWAPHQVRGIGLDVVSAVGRVGWSECGRSGWME